MSDANESLLSPASSSKNTISAKDYNYPTSIADYADYIQDEWGMLYVLMSSWGYAPGVENEYNITGLPSDLCIDVPVFTIDYHRELEGSECIVAHIENGTITFTGNGQENQKKKYLNRAFMKFFFVSDASEASA